MKKKIIISVLAICLLTGCGSTPELEDGKESLVSFKDGTNYSVDEIWDETKNTYGLDVLLDKIDTKILEEEFKDKKDEIKEYIDNYETSLKANYVDEKGNFDEEKLNEALSYYGYKDINALLSKQKISHMKELATTNYVKEQLKDSEISDYYKSDINGDIGAMHILVKPESESEEDQLKASKKAADIIKAIKEDVKSGTKVKDAFLKYKDNKDVTFEDLESFNNGDMVEEFWDASVGLKKDEYSTKPVKTPYGYHVIYKYDEKDKPSLKDSKKKIEEALAKEKTEKDQTLATKAMMDLRKKYGVDFKDSEMKKSYNRYMNSLINQAEQQQKQQNTQAQ